MSAEERDVKSVIVTGAAGFLGSHLSEYLLKRGYTVVGVDNFSTGQKVNIDYLNSIGSDFFFIEADVCCEWGWFDRLPSGILSSLEYIFHFASPASPPHYQRLSIETIWVNTIGLERAIIAADRHKARVVFASTSEIYGDPLVVPQAEEYWGNVNSFGERSCYDEGKRLGEALIFSYNKRNGTKHGLVRIFNTYGPRMNLEDGRVVINFIVQALKGEKLTIYGDGSQTRSFCFVSDLICGIYAYASNNLVEPVNLGNDREFSMMELAQIVLNVVNRHPDDVCYLPLPSDDPKRRRPDLTKAGKLLGGWRPTVSLLEGISRMVDWVRLGINNGA